MSYINVDAAIEEAKSAMEAREKALRRVDVVRLDLRNAVEFGNVTPEQRSWIGNTFPVRTRKSPEERVKDAERILKETKEKMAAKKTA